MSTGVQPRATGSIVDSPTPAEGSALSKALRAALGFCAVNLELSPRRGAKCVTRTIS